MIIDKYIKLSYYILTSKALAVIFLCIFVYLHLVTFVAVGHQDEHQKRSHEETSRVRKFFHTVLEIFFWWGSHV